MKAVIERRRAVQPTVAPLPAALHDLIRRIEAEYREMPGMCVTEPQARRLWGLDSTTCAFALKTLVERGVLRRTAHGTFIRC